MATIGCARDIRWWNTGMSIVGQFLPVANGGFVEVVFFQSRKRISKFQFGLVIFVELLTASSARRIAHG